MSRAAFVGVLEGRRGLNRETGFCAGGAVSSVAAAVDAGRSG